MGKEVKKRKHRILDRPVLSVILLILFVLFISSLFSVTKLIIGGNGADGPIWQIYDMGTALASLLAAELVFTGVWFRGQFEGTLRGEIGTGLRLGAPVLFLDLAIFIFDRITGRGALNNVLMVLSISLVAGIVEEITFRSLILANFMRITRDYRGMLTAVVFSSLVFGSAHFTNLAAGADLVVTIMQFFAAFLMGLFFSGMYLTCGSIVPCMVLHFLHDVLAMLFLGINSSGAVTEAMTAFSMAEEVLMDTLLLVMAILLLRPANYKKIRGVWKRKWHSDRAGSDAGLCRAEDPPEQEDSGQRPEAAQ